MKGQKVFFLQESVKMTLDTKCYLTGVVNSDSWADSL